MKPNPFTVEGLAQSATGFNNQGGLLTSSQVQPATPQASVPVQKTLNKTQEQPSNTAKVMTVYSSLYKARQANISDEQILGQISKYNSKLQPNIQKALAAGISPSDILSKIEKSNLPGFVDRLKMSFGGTTSNQAEKEIDRVEAKTTIGDIADVVGGQFPTAGMLLGGLAGIESGPGAVATAGAGSAAGEGLRQTIGNLLGVNPEGYNAKDIAVQGAVGATAEVGGQAFSKFVLPALTKGTLNVGDYIGLKTMPGIVSKFQSVEGMTAKESASSLKTIAQGQYLAWRTLNKDTVKAIDKAAGTWFRKADRGPLDTLLNSVDDTTRERIKPVIEELLKVRTGNAVKKIGTEVFSSIMDDVGAISRGEVGRLTPYVLEYFIPGMTGVIKVPQAILSSKLLTERGIFRLARTLQTLQPLAKPLMDNLIRDSAYRASFQNMIDNLIQE